MKDIRTHWDRHYSKKMPIYPDEALVRIMSKYRGRQLRVLDLACGGGRHTIMMAEMGFVVTGTDISQEAINHADKWGENVKNVTFVQSDVRRLRDLYDLCHYSRRFDIVVIWGLMCYLTKGEGLDLIRGMHGILDDLGHIIFHIRAKGDFREHEEMEDEKGLTRTVYTFEELKDLLEKNGFELEEVNYWEDSMENMSKIRKSWIGEAIKV